jgi:hypothetical protein
MTANKRCNLKLENEKTKNKLFLDLNKQLIKATLQCDELQKKQKLAAIHSKIETL